MKRYHMMPSKWTLPDRVIEEEHPNGKWVKYEDVENTWGEWMHRNPVLVKENVRLKVLNQEMVEMLKDVLYYELPSDVCYTINEVLSKAGENVGRNA